jgi:type IV pilus assembly protein PilE
MTRAPQTAFTLIELLAALAIVGILSALAYPSYLGYVTRSNRAIAKAQLTQIAAREELYFQDNKQYTSALSALGFSADSYCLDNRQHVVACTAAGRVYRFSVSSTPMTFFATAAPQAQQAERDDRCGSLGTNEQGSRTAGRADCW